MVISRNVFGRVRYRPVNLEVTIHQVLLLKAQKFKEYMENQRLFVGNLSYNTTREELITLFSTFGKVDAISLRPNKGYAYVSMSKPEEARAVIDNLDQTDFKDRLLRIAWELPKKKARMVTRERRKQMAKQHPRKKEDGND